MVAKRIYACRVHVALKEPLAGTSGVFGDMGVLFDKLANPVLEKLGAIWGLKENFKKLRDSLLMVHATLEDAETWQVTDRAVRLWLLKLRDAAFGAEDLLDQFEAKAALMDSGLSDPKFAIDASEMIKTLDLLETTALEGLYLRSRDDVVHELKSRTACPQLAVTSKDNRIDEPPHLVEFDADLGRKSSPRAICGLDVQFVC
ncbi:Rx, N-terminal [Dillenia turbinata]|uniref:Rx, N-terminal n=1 Tax=Dillenia turbinata TaxID=194707 RepID=A0AAN8WA10_9MAGN